MSNTGYPYISVEVFAEKLVEYGVPIYISKNIVPNRMASKTAKYQPLFEALDNSSILSLEQMVSQASSDYSRFPFCGVCGEGSSAFDWGLFDGVSPKALWLVDRAN